MFPFSTPQQGSQPADGLPPQPLSPQPVATPQSGELAPGAPVEFALTPPEAAAPTPSPFGTELPPVAAEPAAPAAPAAPAMMTTKEAEEMLEGLFEQGAFQRVADGTKDILAADPSNAAAQALHAHALAALADPAAAQKLLVVKRRSRLQRKIAWSIAGVALLAGLAAGGWLLFGRGIVPPEDIPVAPAYKLSVSTDPPVTEGIAPFTVRFGLRNESLPEGVTITFDVGDGVPRTTPFSHTFEKAGSYVVTGTAMYKDGTQLDKVEEKVTVRSALEIAIEATPGSGAGSASVAFTSTIRGATGAMEYSWRFGDETASTEPSPTHLYAAPGTYDVTLTVKTPDGSMGTATKQVTVSAAVPILPSGASTVPRGAADAVITTIPRSPDAKTISGAAPFTVFFSAGSSRSENGPISSTHWDFGDSFDSEELSSLHTFSRPGLYKVTLTVADAAGVSGTEAITVNVTSQKAPPSSTGPVSAAIETDVRPNGAAPYAITFDATGSRSTGGAITAYEWDFGDASTLGTGVRASHTYQAPGRYEVVLTVIDAKGQEGTQRLTVTIA